MIAGVRHVLTILAVSRLEEVVAFYQAAFDWERTVETPVYVEFALPDGQRIGVYQREAVGRNTRQVPAAIPDGMLAPVELYFHADDLDGAITRLVAAGAHTLSPLALRDWGDEAAYFADPAGNVVVIARPRTDRT